MPRYYYSVYIIDILNCGKYNLMPFGPSRYKAIGLLAKPVHASDSIFISRIKRPYLISSYLVFHPRATVAIDSARYI